MEYTVDVERFCFVFLITLICHCASTYLSCNNLLHRSMWKARVLPSKSLKKSTMLKVCTTSSNSCFLPEKMRNAYCLNSDHVAFLGGNFCNLWAFFLWFTIDIWVSWHCDWQNTYLSINYQKHKKGSSKRCALKVFLTPVSKTCDDSSYIYPTTVIYVVNNEIYIEGYAIHRDSIIQENTE